MVIRFVPHAEAELTKARKWYAHQRVGLDLELMQCIDEALSRVVANPQSFPLVYGNLRRIVVAVFRLLFFMRLPGMKLM
jgi:hypothetical protein